MKKVLIITFILALILLPSAVLSYDVSSALELYQNEDSLLSESLADYTELTAGRDEAIEKYSNMRLSRRGSFYYAQSKSSKENGLLQIDFNIENAYDSIKARTLKLEIEFRSAFVNLYSSKKAMTEAEVSAIEASEEYRRSLQSDSSGFISSNDLLQLEYNAVSEKNNSSVKLRQYESALRAMNYKTGLPLEYNEYTFSFSEDILDMMDLDTYLSSASENSSSIKLIEQKLSKYYVEKENYDEFTFSPNITTINETLRTLDINIKLQELQLEKTKVNLAENILIKYSSAKIEREKLDLSELNIKILQQDYQTDLSLYNRGYIDKQELSDTYDSLAEAKSNYKLMVYKFNTQVKSLEYDCAYYLEESGD